MSCPRADPQLTLPPFELRPIDGPNDEDWAALAWPDDVRPGCVLKRDGGRHAESGTSSSTYQ
jgi:hypothetical protein